MTSNRVLVLVLATLGLCLPMARAGGVAADSPITVAGTPAVQSSFPNGLSFTISAKDSAPITDVVLHYALVPNGDSVAARADFSKGTDVQATYDMRSNGNPLYLPPGKGITYTWELTDANGAVLTTAEATATFADTRFQWQTVTSGNLSLTYYRGTKADAMALLKIGADAITRAAGLEQTQLDFPVKAFIYATSDDFLPAAQKESKATDPGLLGQALTPDTVILVGTSLGSSETQDTVRHELTHLVTGAAVAGPYQDLLPLWLNEGTSVYAQSDPGDYGAALQLAIQSNSVVPIQVLESSRGVDVGLFYGESYALVKFLIQSGGSPKYAQLLAALKGGASTDQALQSVYGYDRTGLYNAWRDSVHLSGPGAATGGGSAASAGAQPTPDTGANPPAGNGGSDTAPGPTRAGGASEVSDGGAMVLLFALGGALVLALLAAVVAFAAVLSRRARTG